MNLKMPPITFDWTVNLTHILTTLMFILSAVAGFYDLKSDVRDINTRLNNALVTDNAQIAAQKVIDQAQDTRIELVNTQITSELRSTTQDIKSDIRDIRDNLFYGNRLPPRPYSEISSKGNSKQFVVKGN
ncbi:MAG: hypothetical protein ACYC9R_12695 [Nitrosotalea sp.]